MLLKGGNGVPNIVNNRVYLISRGCFYEQLKSQFSVDTLDRTFSMRNNDIKKHLRVSTELNKLTKLKQPERQKETTKEKKYMRKFGAGKIIGL